MVFHFSLTKGAGFKRLIEFLKLKLTLPSPRTASRTLESLETKFALPQLNDKLSKAPNESLHFIVDIWTSRIPESIIGIRPTAKEATAAVERLLENHAQGPATNTDKEASFRPSQSDVSLKGSAKGLAPQVTLTLSWTSSVQQIESNRNSTATSAAHRPLTMC
ncbi:hypothetical protein MRX96_030010 [Rhipicephalus microplus]